MPVTDAEASYMDVNLVPTGGYVCTRCLEEWTALDQVPNGHRRSGACDAAVELAYLAGGPRVNTLVRREATVDAVRAATDWADEYGVGLAAVLQRTLAAAMDHAAANDAALAAEVDEAPWARRTGAVASVAWNDLGGVARDAALRAAQADAAENFGLAVGPGRLVGGWMVEGTVLVRYYDQDGRDVTVDYADGTVRPSRAPVSRAVWPTDGDYAWHTEGADGAAAQGTAATLAEAMRAALSV